MICWYHGGQNSLSKLLVDSSHRVPGFHPCLMTKTLAKRVFFFLVKGSIIALTLWQANREYNMDRDNILYLRCARDKSLGLRREVVYWEPILTMLTYFCMWCQLDLQYSVCVWNSWMVFWSSGFLLMQLSVSESLFGMVQLQASQGFNQDVEHVEPTTSHLVFQKKSLWWLGWPSLLGTFPLLAPA